MQLKEILKLKEAELNKLTKDIIVKAIDSDGWQIKHYEEENGRLKKDVADNVSECNRMKIIISAFLGDELEIESGYYSSRHEPKVEKLSLSVLVSRLMAIADASKATPTKLKKEGC